MLQNQWEDWLVDYMINDIINFLDSKYDGNDYFVKEFSENIFFGKDKENNYVFVKPNNSKEQSFSLNTKSIELFQNYHFLLETLSSKLDGNYDMIILDKKYESTKATFINLCLNFYSNDTNGSIIGLTNDLIELYKMINSGDEKSEQGLWGELFTILYFYNYLNINVAIYWHNDNYNKYDFSITNDLKLEVKSTTKELREHRFSHGQVFTTNNVVISSVLMRKDDSGLTVYDLYKKIDNLFSSDYSLLAKVEKELIKYNDSNLIRYDYEYSEKSIKLYLNKNIPHFDDPEPEGVHGTEYTITLANTQSLSNESLNEIFEVNSNV